MTSELILLEKWFTVFVLIFLTGILRWPSLFVSPDPRISLVNSYNPFDGINSLIQYAIYGIAFLLLIARRRNTIHSLKGSFIIWILPIIALLSFLWSDFPDESLRKGITTIQTTYFGIYFASRFNIKQQLNILAWVFGIIAFLSLIFGVLFHEAAIEMGANAGAFRGPFTQKNLLARISVLGTIVFLINILNSNKSKPILFLGASANILLILISTSKTALLLLVLIVILLPLYKMLRWKSLTVIPIIITVILISSSIAFLLIANWENTLAFLGRDVTLSGRTGLWEATISKIHERPWLGYGYQGFWRDGGAASEIWNSEGYKPPHAHNGFINLALDLGLIGLLAFICLIVTSYMQSIKCLQRGGSAIELWPIYYITFFFMYNHSENTIIEHNSIFWALLIAVVLSVKQYKSSKPLNLKAKRV